MTQLFVNNVFSYLDLPLGINDTELVVTKDSGSKFPYPTGEDYFRITLENGSDIEIVKCSVREGDVMTVERAQEGTTRKYFPIGSLVEVRVTAETLSSKADLVNDIDQDYDVVNPSAPLPKILSWITNRIRTVIGSTNWYDPPARSLNGVNSDLQDHKSDPEDPHPQYLKKVDLPPVDTTGLATKLELDNHVNNLLDAHKASAVTYDGSPGNNANNVEAALDQLDLNKVSKSGDEMQGDLTLPNLTATGSVAWGVGSNRSDEFSDFNQSLRSGWFYGTDPLNEPDDNHTRWALQNVKYIGDTSDRAFQITAPLDADGTDIFVRTMTAPNDPWGKLWNSRNDGHLSGLDADTVDMFQATDLMRRLPQPEDNHLNKFTDPNAFYTGDTNLRGCWETPLGDMGVYSSDPAPGFKYAVVNHGLDSGNIHQKFYILNTANALSSYSRYLEGGVWSAWLQDVQRSAQGTIWVKQALDRSHALPLGDFLCNVNSVGYIKIPIWDTSSNSKKFLYIQWGRTYVGDIFRGPYNRYVNLTFPVKFPTKVLNVYTGKSGDGTYTTTGSRNETQTGMQVYADEPANNEVQKLTITWLAIGL